MNTSHSHSRTRRAIEIAAAIVIMTVPVIFIIATWTQPEAIPTRQDSPTMDEPEKATETTLEAKPRGLDPRPPDERKKGSRGERDSQRGATPPDESPAPLTLAP